MNSRIPAKQPGAIVLLTVLWILTTQGAGGRANKQNPPVIISYGWTMPDTRYLKLHAADMELRPLTGVGTYVSWPVDEAGGVRNDGSATNNLGWQVFENRRFTPEMLKTAIQDVRGSKFRRFKHNVISMNAYFQAGGPFDWFDDARWATVCGNAGDLARVAHIGKFKGIFMEVEQYGGIKLWHWHELKTCPMYSGKTFEQTRAKVRQRGREFITAINQNFPGCVVWMNMGYGYIATSLVRGKAWEDQNATLLGAFIDGILEGSDARTIFVDANNAAYRCYELAEFENLRKGTAEDALLLTQVPGIYRKKVRVGFAIYLDQYQSGPHGEGGQYPWKSDQPDKNFYTPARLEKVLHNALAVGDGYVWIYSEFPSWWLKSADDKFGPGVQCRDDQKWISPVYWKSIENAIEKGVEQ